MSSAFYIGCLLGGVFMALLIYGLARLADFVSSFIILLFYVLLNYRLPSKLKHNLDANLLNLVWD